MTERESLEAILAEVNAWRLANLDKLGTPEFERMTLRLALIHGSLRLALIHGFIDLGERATPAQRAYVMKRLKELEG